MPNNTQQWSNYSIVFGQVGMLGTDGIPKTDGMVDTEGMLDTGGSLNTDGMIIPLVKDSPDIMHSYLYHLIGFGLFLFSFHAFLPSSFESKIYRFMFMSISKSQYKTNQAKKVNKLDYLLCCFFPFLCYAHSIFSSNFELIQCKHHLCLSRKQSCTHYMLQLEEESHQQVEKDNNAFDPVSHCILFQSNTTDSQYEQHNPQINFV
jgi:hypothetical protein